MWTLFCSSFPCTLTHKIHKMNYEVSLWRLLDMIPGKNGSSSNGGARHTKEVVLFNVKLPFYTVMTLTQEPPPQTKKRKNRKVTRKCLAVALQELWWFENESGTSFMKTQLLLWHLWSLKNEHTFAHTAHTRPEIAATAFKCKWRRNALGLTDDVRAVKLSGK